MNAHQVGPLLNANTHLAIPTEMTETRTVKQVHLHTHIEDDIQGVARDYLIDSKQVDSKWTLLC